MRLEVRASLIVLAVALACGAGAQANDGGGGAVTAYGSATLKRAPDLLRVQIQLNGEGKTLKEALEKLATRREACRKKLVSLGAKEEAVSFEDPRIDTGDPRQQQMEQMMRARMNRPGSRPTAAGGAGRVTVASIAKAEWPLAGKSGEELLVVAYDLQEKLKAADLADTKTASLEEQEAREERAGMDGEEQSAPPGQPVFLYVAKVSGAQRAAALADAFKQARANAEDLAKAAGATLGGLKALQSQSDMEQLQMMQWGRYSPYGQQTAQTPEPGEALAPQPGPVTLRLTVSASFAIK
jgi:uncharacterized protein YggE